MLLRYQVTLLVALLFLPFLACADPEPWMKKTNPDELAIIIYTMFDCPFSKDEISAITDDILAEPGIKKIIPDQTDPDDFPALSISAKCAEIPGGYIYDYDIDFVAFRSPDDSEKHVIRLGSHGYGAYGQGRAETALNALRRYIQGAIADYVSSNSDLQNSGQ